jgi:hypothetical protein
MKTLTSFQFSTAPKTAQVSHQLDVADVRDTTSQEKNGSIEPP